MAMGSSNGRKRVDELTLFEERLYVCLYNIKPRDYRKRKTFAVDNVATALAIIVARSLVYNYRAVAAVTRLHLSLLGEVRT